MPPCDGFRLFPARLSPEAQEKLVAAVMAAAQTAPFYRPLTPGGKPMSVDDITAMIPVL